MTKEGILNILKQLEESLYKLKIIKKNYTINKFLHNQDIQDIAKWNFYIISQACLDIGNHAIATLDLGTPETYEEILEILKNKERITRKTADQLQGLAGFRNRLAHGYFKIDPELLYKHLSKLTYIQTYIREVKNLLKV